jgi:serine/threonine protein phosphatase PrpC
VVVTSHEGQDRVEVMRLGDVTVMVVADGSGGMSGGAQAAEHALREIMKAARRRTLSDQTSWTSMLADADSEVARRTGQCAVVAVALVADRIVGASVGDCGAWLVTVNGIDDLTDTQVRKPLLGSGEAVPVAFEAVLRDSTLLLATDGLLKYGRRDRIAVLARGADLQVAVQLLAELPRLRSGALPDDVGVILCRS